MVLKVVLGIAVVLGAFLVYVSTRDGKFRYEKSWLIQAPAEKIYPQLASFENGNKWSYYMLSDPTMKAEIVGPESQPGTRLNFGADLQDPLGYLEFLNFTPNQKVEMRLMMLKPFQADSLVDYELTPEGDATRFTWSMRGDGGFISKLMTVLLDCEKLATAGWDESAQNLKRMVESQP